MYNNLNRGVIRIPLLALSDLQKIRLANLSDCHILERLKLLCTPAVIEALYVSSPDFIRIIELIISESGEKLAYPKMLEVWLTFVKYYTRMCSRGTPFGLMASVGVISITQETIIQKDFDGFVHAQLDNAIVSELAHRLENREGLKSKLNFFSNPSIYKQANKLKYLEVTKRDGAKEFALSKVDNSLIIRKILNYCRTGKKISDISAYVQYQLPGVYDHDDIEEFVFDLIDNQLLLSSFSSCSTKNTLFLHILETLERFDYQSEEAEEIFLIAKELKKIDKINWDANKSIFSSIEDSLKRLKLLHKGSSMLHVNFIRSFSKSSINDVLIRKIKEAVDLIASTNEIYKFENIEAFKSAFIDRYEDRYIPLSEVLDEEIGIGYPVGNLRNPKIDGCLDGLILPSQSSLNLASTNFNPYYNYLLNKIGELKASQVLELTTDDLKGFATKQVKLPPTYSVSCSLLGKCEKAIDNGDFSILLFNNSFTSALSALNRFAVSDKEIKFLSKDIVEKEKNIFGGKIVAEVLHSSNSRIENIAFRAITRDYEIPIDTLSTNELNRQICLKDILVGIVGNRIRLVSRKDKKEIVPKISNSHVFNLEDSLPAYHFLGDMQLQDQQNNLLWDWGPLSKLHFLPRVVLNSDIICSLATWKVTLEKAFFNECGDLTSRLSKKLSDLGLPKLVSLRQNGDNLLVIDIEDQSCLLILLKEFKKYPFLVFHEYLFRSDNVFVKDRQGRGFVNELIIPYVSERSDHNNPTTHAFKYQNRNVTEKGAFFPGEEFLYLKIYCTKNIGQLILLKCLLPLFFNTKTGPDTIFFVRYEDPDNHIRLRIRKEENELLIAKIYKSLNKLITDNFIYKIQTDTYLRELNRYSTISYDKTEKIFSVDSRAILHVLKLLGDSGSESLTWIIAIKNIYSYLSNFGMAIEEMLSFCRTTRDNFFLELKLNDKEFLKSLNTKFKKSYLLINGIIRETDPDFQNCYEIFRTREDLISEMVNAEEKKRIVNNQQQLFSYVHMSINRLFSSDQRFKEAISYDLLHSFLLSQRHVSDKITFL